MFSFFTQSLKKPLPMPHIYRSASALKIYTYIQSLNHYNISPEFAQTIDLCLIFEDIKSDSDALEFHKNNKHLARGKHLHFEGRKRSAY